jgi:hypothetical protein
LYAVHDSTVRLKMLHILWNEQCWVEPRSNESLCSVVHFHRNSSIHPSIESITSVLIIYINHSILTMANKWEGKLTGTALQSSSLSSAALEFFKSWRWGRLLSHSSLGAILDCCSSKKKGCTHRPPRSIMPSYLVQFAQVISTHILCWCNIIACLQICNHDIFSPLVTWRISSARIRVVSRHRERQSQVWPRRIQPRGMWYCWLDIWRGT